MRGFLSILLGCNNTCTSTDRAQDIFDVGTSSWQPFRLMVGDSICVVSSRSWIIYVVENDVHRTRFPQRTRIDFNGLRYITIQNTIHLSTFFTAWIHSISQAKPNLSDSYPNPNPERTARPFFTIDKPGRLEQDRNPALALHYPFGVVPQIRSRLESQVGHGGGRFCRGNSEDYLRGISTVDSTCYICLLISALLISGNGKVAYYYCYYYGCRCMFLARHAWRRTAAQ